MLTRRGFVTGSVATIGAAATLSGAHERRIYARKLGTAVAMESGKTVAVQLIAAERSTSLPCFGGRSLPMWTFTEANGRRWSA